VSLNRAVGLTKLSIARPRDDPCVASMISINVPERMNELGDGVTRPFNVTREGHVGPYRKSRLTTSR
jgi:hypothetical protein